MDGSQLNHKARLLYGRQFQDEWIITCLEGGCIKTRGWRDSGGSKNKWAQWAELHAAFLAVVEELSNGKSPYVWVFTPGPQPMAWPCGPADGQRKPGLLKGLLHGAQPYGNHSGNLRGVLK